jgi:DNA primase
MITAEQICRRLTPEQYYQRYLKNTIRTSSKWVAIRCPFHDDRKPSLGINTESGGFFCHACEAKGKNIIHFEMRRYGLDYPAAREKLCAEWGIEWNR